MDIEKSRSNLKRIVRMDASMIPSFINNTDMTHRNCIDISIYVFEEIYKLINNVILSKGKIGSITISVNVYLSEMSLIDQGLSMLYYEYYRDMIIGYFEYCELREMWEVCYNLDKFYQGVYKEKIKYNNE